MKISIDTKNASSVASLLLKIEAVKLSPESPFTWASGWKSPIYCDNRLSLSFPEARKTITDRLCDTIKENYPNAEVIAGVATAGIPQGALIAERLGLPFIYVRSKAKSHGMTNLIEGKVVKGQKCVVIEDLISTGGSSLKAAADLREAEIEVVGMAAIFTYGFDVATKNFEEANVSLACLTDYPTMIDAAIEANYVQANQLENLNKWRESPSTWG